MLRLFTAATVFAILCSAAHAQEGSYFGSGEGDLTTVITPLQDDIYSVDLTTTTPMDGDMAGCAGAVSGGVNLSPMGGKLVVANEDYDPADADNPMFGNKYCEVSLDFVDGQLMIQEGDGCLSYHGAACGFTGELTLETGAN
jgi:hypothetical protein